MNCLDEGFLVSRIFATREDMLLQLRQITNYCTVRTGKKSLAMLGRGQTYLYILHAYVQRWAMRHSSAHCGNPVSREDGWTPCQSACATRMPNARNWRGAPISARTVLESDWL